ncbi:MAG: hypothetical protein K0U75_14075 [Actinomycetia bacterium]|nr:hypothetical protein [Actinomycetes bacterium]
MRIRIRGSAREHGITDAEIRAVVSFRALTAPLAARKPGAQPQFYTGPANPNEPWIEIIADLAEADVVDVFHAMMLRPSVFAAVGLVGLATPTYGPQRK